jgi:hypothetical protein
MLHVSPERMSVGTPELQLWTSQRFGHRYRDGLVAAC